MKSNQDKLTPRRLTKREIAERIAESLLTNGAGERADRLMLESGNVSKFRSLGGWANYAVADHIEKILDDLLE